MIKLSQKERLAYKNKIMSGLRKHLTEEELKTLAEFLNRTFTCEDPKILYLQAYFDGREGILRLPKETRND